MHGWEHQVLTGRTPRATPASVLVRVDRRLRGGRTILLHDSDLHAAPGSWRATLGALPNLIEQVQQRLRIGPLREHYGSHFLEKGGRKR